MSWTAIPQLPRPFFPQILRFKEKEKQEKQ